MEAEFLRWLHEHIPPHPLVPLGFRDDAALLRLAGNDDIVLTTDALSDGVDFRLTEHAPRRVGRKALAVNLSDLAAMAASPAAALVNLVLPRAGVAGLPPLELAIQLFEGLLPLATEFDVAIAGGDTNVHDGPLVISVTALGRVTMRRPLTRSGGQVGDKLLVTGVLGGSILGHHFDFTPRVREAILLNERYDLHAGIDISDGLALDASRLAAASGCGAVLNLDAIPIAEATRGAPNAIDRALGDGEDFELLFAVPRDAADAILRDRMLECCISCIGELVAEDGLWKQAGDAGRERLAMTGWLH